MTLGTRHKAANMYTVSRCNADMSRIDSAWELHMSDRTLARYELNDGPPPLPDAVLAMSKLYKDPYLAARYCSEVCAIGLERGTPVEIKDLTGAVLSLIKEHNDIVTMKDKLIEIAADGQISKDEENMFSLILGELDHVAQKIQTIKLLAANLEARKEKAPAACVAEPEACYSY